MINLRREVPLFALTKLAVNTANRMVYPFLAAFGRGLGVDLVTISSALMVRSLVSAGGPFLASIADSRGRKAGMLLGLSIFTVGMGLVVAFPSLWAFTAALACSQLGHNIFLPSVQAYLGDRVPYNKRGLVIALVETSWSASFIAGVPLMGLLIARFGWRSPFPLLAGAGLLGMALIAWMVTGEASHPARPSNFWRSLRTVLTTPAALAALACSLGMTTANESINLVFGVWMEDRFGLQIAALGAASIVIGLSELGGEAFSGGLTDRLGKRRAVAAGLVLNSLSALALPLVGKTVPGALVGLFLFYISFEFTVVSSLPLATEVLPKARATLMATNMAAFSLGRALGASLAPQLYGIGILACAALTVIFNLLALAALSRVRISG